MNPSLSIEPRKAPPFWLSFLLCFACVTFIGWMRLAVFTERIFPLSAGLPLLLCLWTRDLRLLYGTAGVLSLIHIVKILWIMPGEPQVTGSELVMLGVLLLNIWLIAIVIHALLGNMKNIERKNDALAALNLELEAGNEELAAREEEIARQNEELHNQSEELEQQSEELRQQAEEMEQQSADLHALNLELGRREKGLQTLLNSGRWLRGEMNEGIVLSGVCQAALQIMPEDVHVAEVVAEKDGAYTQLGNAGYGLHGMADPDFPFSRSFAALAIEAGRTVSIGDIWLREDIRVPQPRAGRPFRAALASPIWHEGRPVAVLCLYTPLPYEWLEHDFSISEWLASQAALALQSIRFRQELEIKRRDAEDAALQKSRFLAAVSHDVRTPANAISLLAELIDKCAYDPEKVVQVPALAKNLWNNARSLVDLVSDVLDLARLDSGRGDLHVTTFPLADLIQAEAAQARTLASEKTLAVDTEIPAGIPPVTTDRTKLARILSNLLSNAVKFTETGGIRIVCLREEDGGVKIHIKDTGIGIPAHSLSQIFDEFFQLRNPERDREKGSGLGLAICRRLAENLGCTIEVESLVGLGTTFTLHLPKSLFAAAGQPVGETTSPAADLHGLRVLLVEDHDVARETISELLRGAGAAVRAAGSGREALTLLREGEYDALLLDLNLPDMDGSEILRSLHHQRPPALKRVLVVTGDARPARVREAAELGADGVISKPVSLAVIRSALG